MTKPVVFLSQPMHAAGIDLLKQHAEVIEGVYHPVASDTDIRAALSRADAVMIRSMPIGADRIAAAPRLKVIAKHGAGLDSIDIPAASARGIVVANSGDANAFAVAQHAVALMMAVQRNIIGVDAIMRGGGYQQREKMAGLGDLWEMTIGLLGFGNIGRHAAHMLGRGFNARILAYDPGVSAEAMAELGATKVDDVGAILDTADIVSLHLPLTDKTRHIIGAAELARMKPTAALVNTSRGGVIDEVALVEALKANSIRGAGLDVFEIEPPARGNPLFALDNVVLSPHVGGGSEVAMRKTALAAAQAILDVLEGRPPAYFINEREITKGGANPPV